jgi:hypothetical protein
MHKCVYIGAVRLVMKGLREFGMMQVFHCSPWRIEFQGVHGNGQTWPYRVLQTDRVTHALAYYYNEIIY